MLRLAGGDHETRPGRRLAAMFVLCGGLIAGSSGHLQAQRPQDPIGHPEVVPGGERSASVAGGVPLQVPAEWQHLPEKNAPAWRPDVLDPNPNDTIGFDPVRRLVVRERRQHTGGAARSAVESRSTPAHAGLLPGDIAGWSRPQVVHGPDGRTRITPTTGYPWRTIVRIVVSFASGTYLCSGALIGQGSSAAIGFHVMTAGHCVYDPTDGGWPTSMWVMPAVDGGLLPYSYGRATYFRSDAGWVANGSYEHDWGIVTLDRPYGTLLGFMGRRTAPPASSYYTDVVNLAGYPADKGGDELWFDADLGAGATEHNHYYYVDTAGGQSGSPVWWYDAATGDRSILTVHAYGDMTTNFGSRLNQARFDAAIAWTLSDSPPPELPDLVDGGAACASFSPATAVRGQSAITINHCVRNLGLAPAAGFWVTYYVAPAGYGLLSDAVLEAGTPSPSGRATVAPRCLGDGTCTVLGTQWVAGAGVFDVVNVAWTGTVPHVPPGSYVLSWWIDSSGQPNGEGGLQAEYDEDNNVGTAATALRVVLPAPNVFSIDPVEGAGGTGVTILGSDFVAGSTTVLFGTTPATGVTVCCAEVAGRLTAIAPQGTGTVDVTVSTPYGSRTIAGAFTYRPGPTIGSLDPARARVRSAAFVLTVDGTGFRPGATVTWNGSPRPTTFVTDTRLTAQISANDVGAPATARVSVANPLPHGNSASTPFEVDPDWMIAGAGHFNGDACADLVWQNQAGYVAAWLMDGTTQVANLLLWPHAAAVDGWRVAAAGDLNGDGMSDLIWQNTNGYVGGWIMNGTAQIENGLLSPHPAGAGGWRIVGAADLNGDARDDILWQDDAGFVAAWMMNGLAQVTAVLLHPEPVAAGGWRIMGTGDLNGDARVDLLWQSPDGYVAAWIMNGSSVAHSVALHDRPAAADGWSIAAAADLDGDGDADLIWQNDDNHVAAWIMDGLTYVRNTLLTPGIVAGVLTSPPERQ